MANLHSLGPSPLHAKYQALMPDFWAKVDQQEANLLKQGLPAEGIADFIRGWFDAWATQSPSKLSDYLTVDCSFIDSSTFQQVRHGRQTTLDFLQPGWDAMPDTAFYPQDETNRSLPYYDYFEGEWRMTIPWRLIARWTGEVRLPGSGIRIAPTGQCLDAIGIDRYVLTDDFKIKHIDTDYDLAFAVQQLLPINLPTSVPTAVIRPAMAVQRLVTPPLRMLNRLAS